MCISGNFLVGDNGQKRFNLKQNWKIIIPLFHRFVFNAFDFLGASLTVALKTNVSRNDLFKDLMDENIAENFLYISILNTLKFEMSLTKSSTNITSFFYDYLIWAELNFNDEIDAKFLENKKFENRMLTEKIYEYQTAQINFYFIPLFVFLSNNENKFNIQFKSFFNKTLSQITIKNDSKNLLIDLFPRIYLDLFAWNLRKEEYFKDMKLVDELIICGEKEFLDDIPDVLKKSPNIQILDLDNTIDYLKKLEKIV